MVTPCGRFFIVGSSLILGQTSPVTKPGARSAPTAMRRVWLVRWTVVGPAPKPISATDFSGTDPPLDGRHGQVLDRRQVAARILGDRHGDRHLAVGQREFGAVLVDVAHRRDADRLAERRVVTPRSAARSNRGLMMISGRTRSPPTRGARSSGKRLHLVDILLATREQLPGSSPPRNSMMSRLTPPSPGPPPLWLRKLTRASAISASLGVQPALELGAGLGAVLLEDDVDEAGRCRRRCAGTRDRRRGPARRSRGAADDLLGLLEGRARRHADARRWRSRGRAGLERHRQGREQTIWMTKATKPATTIAKR